MRFGLSGLPLVRSRVGALGFSRFKGLGLLNPVA